MKYTHGAKRRRNHALEQYRTEHPDLSLKEIGEAFGITKQRVCQILKDLEKEKRNG